MISNTFKKTYLGISTYQQLLTTKISIRHRNMVLLSKVLFLNRGSIEKISIVNDSWEQNCRRSITTYYNDFIIPGFIITENSRGLINSLVKKR